MGIGFVVSYVEGGGKKGKGADGMNCRTVYKTMIEGGERYVFEL